METVFVTLIRNCSEENETHVDHFSMSMTNDPEQMLRDTIRSFLLTREGHDAIANSSEDFNWGDSILYVPWSQYQIDLIDKGDTVKIGILKTVVVDQDEVLVPEEYYEQEVE